MEFNFDKLYKIPIWYLTLNRSYPGIRRDMKWGFQFFIIQGLCTTTFFVLVNSIIFYDEDLAEICYKGTLAVFAFVITFVYCVFLTHQKTIWSLIVKIKEDYKVMEGLPLADQKAAFYYIKKVRLVANAWNIIVMSSALLFPLKSVVLMVHKYMEGKFKPVPIIQPITYPAALEAVRDDLIPFTAVYLISLWYTAYTASMYIGFAPIGPILMSHACAKLEIVKLRIKELFLDDDDDEQTDAKLRHVIGSLQDTYSFMEFTQKSLRSLYEMSLKVMTFTIPIAAFQIIETFRKAGLISLEFITILGGCFVLSAFPCYFGELLIQQGEGVREEVYASGWERRYRRRQRTAVLALLTRTTRPVGLYTMFRVLSLDALSEMYNQSYAIFNLLNAAYK